MPLLQLLVALLLIAVNAFFVSVEFSLARVRPTQVDEWEREGHAGAGAVRHAVDRIDAYLAACQLGITVASLGLGVLGERAFETLLGDGARLAGIGLASLLAFLLITVLHVVGELSPKSVAIARTERVALLVARPMRVFYAATRPLVDAFNALGNLLLVPFGIPPAREAGHAPHSEDELRSLVAESEREGLIEPEEQAFADNAFTFGDRSAREVMVARESVRCVTTDETVEDAVALVRETGFTRLPLCRPDGGLDASVGLVNAKDLLGAEHGGASLQRIARPLDRLPAATCLDDVLERLRARREHLALVVEPDGHAAGVVTLEDVLEQIVGPIDDEFDRGAAAVGDTPTPPQGIVNGCANA